MLTNNIVMAVRAPARLYLGQHGNEDGDYLLDSVRARTGFPPWPSGADLLVSTATREFCGVAYQVGGPFQPLVRELAAALDPQCVRYIDCSSSQRPVAYREESSNLQVLEFVWSDVEPDRVLPAQLGGDVWYYAAEIPESATPVRRVVGYGVPDLVELLDEYHIVMPARFTLPTTLKIRKVVPESTPN
jgi:hypothetical protein